MSEVFSVMKKQGPKWGQLMKKKTEIENLMQVYLYVAESL
jgi:hypothetical protein